MRGKLLDLIAFVRTSLARKGPVEVKVTLFRTRFGYLWKSGIKKR